ncbi:MAG: hypothetical protein QXX55_00915 [Candidatus Pacearchaeota archaeon]
MVTKKSLKEIIPIEYTPEHEEAILKLMRENKEFYNEIFDLAWDSLEDENFCKKYGIESIYKQKQGDLFRLIYAFGVQKGYIKEVDVSNLYHS